MTQPSDEYVNLYLRKARGALIEARAVAKIELAVAAGRAAYHCAYHAAQAFVFARTAKIAKTHSGVRSEFARLAKDERRIAPEFPAFLGRAYNLKSIADYGVEIGVSLAEAADAIASAERFFDCIAAILTAATDEGSA